MANREMKDSGVEWIGKIPKHWEVMTLKRSTISVKGGIWGEEEKKDENDIPCVRITDFDRSNYTLLDKDLILRNLPQEKHKDYILNKGDLLIEKSGGGAKTPVGQVVIYNKDYPAIYTNFTAKIEINKQIVSSEYFNYLNATLYNLGITVRSIKQTTGIQNLDLNNYLMEKASFPTIEEQQKIATFLDEKVAHIDNIIEDTKKSIENLKAYKQSLITETVTKGLDSNVEMKDSGIEWVGKIPHHWNKEIAKRIFNKEQREIKFNDIITCFRDGEVTLRKNRRTDGFTVSTKEIGYQGIKKGDLVIHQMDAFAGAIGVSDSNGKSTPVYTVCTSGEDYNNYYYAYLLRSYAKVGYIESMAKGIRERSTDFRYATFSITPLLVPPIAEQNDIVSFLDSNIHNVDELISQKEKLITELEAYKKSLIYEYITGKKEVK